MRQLEHWIQKSRRDAKIKLYKTMDVSVLLCGSELWILTDRDRPKMQAAEMRFNGG